MLLLMIGSSVPPGAWRGFGPQIVHIFVDAQAGHIFLACPVTEWELHPKAASGSCLVGQPL
jgi:hypothetical protein